MTTWIIVAIGWFVFAAIAFFMRVDEWSVDEKGILIIAWPITLAGILVSSPLWLGCLIGLGLRKLIRSK